VKKERGVVTGEKRIKKAEKNWWAIAATATAILYVCAQRYMWGVYIYIYIYIYI